MTPESYLKPYAPQPPLCAEDVFPVTQGPSCPLSEAPCETMPSGGDCCCKMGMAQALRLLCDPELSELIDFEAFAFLTCDLAVGGQTVAAGAATAAQDNIPVLGASFRRFSPCNCDLLEIDAPVYPSVPGAGLLFGSVSQVSLCAVKAIAFGVEAVAEGGVEDPAAAFRRASRLLRRRLSSVGTPSGCGACQAHCDCDNCCCAAGILTELSARNLSRRATLVTGTLVLQNVTVLGSVDGTLVLANDEQNRFYLVCAEAIEALA